MKKLFLLFLALCGLPLGAQVTIPLIRSTLQSSVGLNDTQITVTGYVAIIPDSRNPGNVFVDAELMRIISVQTTGTTTNVQPSTVITVSRGVNGTAAAMHNPGAGTYIGWAYQFVTTSFSGSCPLGSAQYVNYTSQLWYACVAGNWTSYSTTIGGGSGGSGNVSTAGALTNGNVMQGAGGQNIADSGIPTSTLSTLNGTQTLTNKTISGSSNTLTNIPNGALPGSGTMLINSITCTLGGSNCLVGSGGATTPATTLLLQGTGVANGVTAGNPNGSYQGFLGFSPIYYGNGTTNGIAGAVTACAALSVSCSILVPPTYAVTETLAGFSLDPNNPTLNGNSTMAANTYLEDRRYAGLQFTNNNIGYHYNLLNSVHAWQHNFTNPIPVMNLQNGLNIQMNFPAGGFSLQDSATGFYNKSTMSAATFNVNTTTPGQHINSELNTVCNSPGDCIGLVNFVRSGGGFSAQADEGAAVQNNRAYEWNVEYAGTLTGTPTTSSITVSPTQGASPPVQGAGHYVVRTNTGMISAGTISAISTADGSPTVMTGSSTGWPVSTVVGTLGTQVSAIYVTNATCASPIVLTVGLSETAATGSSAVVTGVIGLTAANGTWTITAIDNTHMSLNGSTCTAQTYQAGGYVAVPQVITPSAFTIGSMAGITTSTPVVIASYGNYEIVLPTAVTSTTFSAVIRKTYPATSTIAVGGLAGYLMDLKADEVTSSTFPTNDENVSGTLRYAWPVLYSTSASSATVWVSGGGAYRALNSRWTNAGSGLNTYTLYQGAEITSVMSGGNVSNVLSLAPGTSNTAWNVSDTVEQLPYPANHFAFGNTIMQHYYPCFATASCGWSLIYNGPMTGNDTMLGLTSTTPSAMYVSGGGQYTAPLGIHISGITNNTFLLDHMPDNALVSANCANTTGSCNKSPSVFALNGAHGYDYFTHIESTGSWNIGVNGSSNYLTLGYASGQAFFGSQYTNQFWMGTPSIGMAGSYAYLRTSCGTTPTSGHICYYWNTDGTIHTLNSSGVDSSYGGGGMIYPSGTGIPQVTSGTSWGTTLSLQGTDTKVMTAGTVSGAAGTTLCIDGNLGATTVGCTTGGGVNATSIQGIAVSTTAPSVGQALVDASVSGTSTYVPTQIYQPVQGTDICLTTGSTTLTFALCPINSFTVLANNTNASAAPAAITAAGMFGILGDDQTNAIGLGAAASLRKTIHTDQVSGLTLGAGQTTGVRTANCTALQAVFNDAAANGWRVDIVPGVYEIYCSAGLTVTNTNDTTALWITGSQQARIIQFYANAPAMTIGDAAASATDYSINVNLDGIRLEYGVSQTGNTGANLMQIGALRSSTIRHIWLGADGGSYTAPNTPYAFPAYRPFYIVSGATAPFSVTFDSFFIQGAQYRLADLSGLAGGTGNLFTNWYMTNGYGGQPGQVSNCALYVAGAGGGIFQQFNIEGVIANVVVNAQTWRGGAFDSFHFESIQLTGANPIFWQAGTDRIAFNDLEITGFYFTSATLNTLTASGTGSVISTYGDDAVTCINCTVQLQNSGNVVNLPLQVITTANVGDTQPSIEMTNFSADDFVSGGLLAHLNLDANTPLANFAGPSRISHYKWGSSISHIDGAVRSVSSTYTLYGQDTDPTIQVPASITSFTLNLSNTNGASGNPSTSLPKVGNVVHVRRDSGTASGTLTIVDVSSSNTLATNTTAAADLYFKFDGLRYRTISDTTSFANSSGGSSSLSGITAATASNTLANGNNPQVWNWATTTSGETAFTFGETTASTAAGTPYLLQAITLAGSTATPLGITNSLTGSQALPTLQISPTWNTSGGPCALCITGTLTSENTTTSRMIEVKSGSTELFGVDVFGALYLNARVKTMNGLSTNGNFGVVPNLGSTGYLTSQSASISSTALVTAPNFVGDTYPHMKVSCAANVHTTGTGSVTISLTWTDANSNAHTATSSSLSLASATSNGEISFDHNIILPQGNVINYSTTYTGTGSYDMGCDGLVIY